jgi:adenylosuccinate synthase
VEIEMNKAVIVVDLSYGDAGKGCVVDFLASQAPSRVVKCSGGHQCAHNVQVGSFNHCFSQFGSGSHSGATTEICGDFIIEPVAMRNELEALTAKLTERPKIAIAPTCPVTTPWEMAVNRCMEFSRTDRHGSCGKGIGETRFSWHSGIGLTAADLKSSELGEKLRIIRSNCEARIISAGVDREYWVEDSLFDVEDKMMDAFLECLSPGFACNESLTIFEGSQGFYLDQYYGHHPHTTWGDVTSRNAREIAKVRKLDTITIGVIRSYVTRHGDGPMFGDEIEAPQEMHNKHNEWQGSMRAAYWDIEALQAAMAVNKVDYLAVNHLDVYDGILDDLEAIGAKVVIEGRGPDRADKTFTKIGEEMMETLQ